MIKRRSNIKTRAAQVASAPISQGKELDVGAVSRALDQLSTAAVAASQGYLNQAGVPIDVDIVVGTNKISHGLGRPAVGVLAIPRDSGVAMLGFDPQQPGNANPSSQVWITSLSAGRYRLVVF